MADQRFRAVRALIFDLDGTLIDSKQDLIHSVNAMLRELKREELAAELIREHVLMQTHEEVPHAVSVLIEQFEESPRMTRIAAVIFCEREGQKAILLGKGGQMLKKIGTAARLDIEKMVGTKVFLELFVKIKAGWRDSRTFVEELDWRRQFQQIGGLPESES